MPIHLIASSRTIDAMKPGARRLNDGDGLHLRKSSNGKKYWYQDYTLHGRRNSIALGAYPVIGLAEARRRSLEVRRQVAHGTDPCAARRSSRRDAVDKQNSVSVQAVASAWLSVRSKEWSPSHAQKTRVRLEAHVYPALGDRFIGVVKTKDVTRLLEGIRDAGTIETAQRVLSICRRVFDYAVSQGHLEANPCHLVKEVLPTTVARHHAAFTNPDGLQRYLVRAHAYHGSLVVQAALALLPMMLLRPAEFWGARWVELDLHNGMWTVPAERMKGTRTRKLNGGPHFVPLPRQAVAILQQLKTFTGNTDYVFAGQGRKHPIIANNTLNKAIRAMGFSTRTEQTAHGFRATARTMLVEQLGWTDNIVELQLDHTVRDANGRAYNRTRMLSERAAMLQQWANYLDGLRESPSASADSIPTDSTTPTARGLLHGPATTSPSSLAQLQESTTVVASEDPSSESPEPFPLASQLRTN